MRQKIKIIFLHCFYILGFEFVVKSICVLTFLRIEQFVPNYPQNPHPTGMMWIHMVLIASFEEEFACRTFMDGKIKSIIVSILATISNLSILYVHSFTENSRLLVYLVVFSFAMVVVYILLLRNKSNFLNRKARLSVFNAHLISISCFTAAHIPKYYLGFEETSIIIITLVAIAFSAYLFGKLRLQYGLHMAMLVHFFTNMIVYIT